MNNSLLNVMDRPELSLGFGKQEFRTPIWQKVGVPLEKVGVPLQKVGVPPICAYRISFPFQLEVIHLSHFRSTDVNPLSINGLFLLNKTKYFAIFLNFV